MIFDRKPKSSKEQNFSNRFIRQEIFLQRVVFLLNLTVLGGLVYLALSFSVQPTKQISSVESLTLVCAAAILLISSLQLIRVLMIRKKAMRFDTDAFLDELTGTLSRDRFQEILQDEIRRAGRYHVPLTLCTIDLDDFSSYENHFGKEGADKVLKKFSHYFLGSIRSTDKLSRSGDDEFTLLLPHTDLVRSEKVLSRILNESTDKMELSFSVGLTSYRAGETQEQFETRSKMALEEAKKAGKKRIRCVIGHDGGHSVLEF